MCGITGIISFERSELNLLNMVEEMNRRIRHRGPDDEGFVVFNNERYWTVGSADTQDSAWGLNSPYKPETRIEELKSENPQIVLGHRRLSIIDLSPAGHQPMCDQNGRYWLVFNGAIYNFEELKLELLQLGFTFYSHTDSEVLLYSYIAWGEACVNRFIGMWAFVIYDKEEKSIFASRDRIGVKPFYYTFDNNRFAFASEIKALTVLPFVNKELNDRAVFDFLILGWNELEEESIFKNIFELPPAHNLRILLENKSVQQTCYYSPGIINKWENFDQAKNSSFAKELTDLLQDSIKLHLRTDAKIGACLSGGLDSSIITGLIAEKKNNLPVFTSVCEGNPEDESKWAGKMVDHFHFNWNKINPSSKDLFSNFEEFIYDQELPVTGANSYSHYELMRLVNSQNVKVTLDGQGADELFAGYSQYYGVFLLEAFLNGKVSNVVTSLIRPGNDFAKKNETGTLLNIGLSKLLGKQLTSIAFKNKHRESSFINSDFWESYSDRILLRQNKVKSSLNATLYKDYHGNMLKNMLRVGDRSSMRFGVESRTIFCDDYRLENLAFRIPAVYKVRNNLNKHILREAAKEFLPEEVYLRKDKKGFSVPERKWLIEMGEEAFSYFDRSLQPFLNVDLIKKNWTKNLHQTKSTKWAWRILCFSVWMKSKNRF